MERKRSPARYSPAPNINTFVPNSCIEQTLKCPWSGLFGSRFEDNIEMIRLVTNEPLLVIGKVDSSKVTMSAKSLPWGSDNFPLDPLLHTRNTPLERLIPQLGTSSPPISRPGGWTKTGMNLELLAGELVKKLRINGASPS